MPNFHYSGRDNSGALVSGNIDAGTADDVAAQLFGDRVTPIEINEIGSSKKSNKPTKSSSNSGAGTTSDITTMESIGAFFGGSKVEVDDLIMFSRQMFSLTKAGLPLDRAIKGLEASLDNPSFRKILRDVISSLENGMTLATALGRHPKVFTRLYLSLIHVGENTGQLDMAFKEVGKYLELEKNTKKQVKSATRYPMFVLGAITIALGIITTFVIPVFSETFARLGADLPWQTVVLMETSNFVLKYWPLLIGAIAALVFGFFSYLGTEKGRHNWDRRKLKFPLAGTVFERVALGRFARTFSMVMRAGVPIVQGLNVVAGAVGNAYISRKIYQMREGIERGESLHRTASNTRMFSPLVLQMIAVGEETGTVDDLLSEVADFYDAEVEYDLKRLGDAIEPILITFIAGLVLILALGVFLPIWDLNTAVQ
ncbi:MAG: MSHA biogenesis protein MshG [SAR86 cluster bacterium]|uniref:MSHA biogenesis protein MshG n=1 Tax=SAR86 cluster bacterium TaxID=2030880 RepID=A0A2A5AXB5_9GAMM|nr:MAG: MSHA biogenesis protein MshG [SAR86 cluster bacterium]